MIFVRIYHQKTENYMFIEQNVNIIDLENVKKMSNKEMRGGWEKKGNESMPISSFILAESQ